MSGEGWRAGTQLPPALRRTVLDGHRTEILHIFLPSAVFGIPFVVEIYALGFLGS